jgi:uncharacterized membrane protein YuzA (DUF378 family)
MLNNFKINAYIYILLKIIVIIGALSWGLMAIDKKYNIVEMVHHIWLLSLVDSLTNKKC